MTSLLGSMTLARLPSRRLGIPFLTARRSRVTLTAITVTQPEETHMRYNMAKTDPRAYKHQIECIWCHDIFGARRNTSKTCSDSCRQAHYRAEKRKRETGSYIAQNAPV